MAAKPALGLYLSDQFIQLAKVNGGGVKLEFFEETALPSGVIVNGEIQNPTELTRQLGATLQKVGIRHGQNAVLGISDSRVFLREFTIPKLPGKDIEDAINWQVRSLLPVLPAEVETDWSVIGRDANDQIEVLLAAIPKTVINAYIKVAEAGGLTVVALEPVVFANVRAIDPEQLKGKNQLLVYLASGYAEMAYLTNGQPRFSDYLTAADVRKRGNIVKVITDYINFVNSKHPFRPVGEVIISGFHPDAVNLLEHLKSIKVSAALAKERIRAGVNQNSLSTAVGLSLKPHDVKKEMDLLPIPLRLAEHTGRIQSSWQLILGLMILATGGFAVWLLINFFSLQGRLAELNNAKSTLTEALPPATKQELIKNVNDLNALTDQLTTTALVTGGEQQLLLDLAASVPSGVALTSLLYTRDTRSNLLADPFSSWVITGVADSRPLVLALYQSLGSRQTFPNARLYYSSFEKETAVDFIIAGTPVRR